MSTREDLERKIDKLEVNMDRTDRIVNGEVSEDVMVDGGVLVPSVRKWQKELEEEYGVPTELAVRAETAAGEAEGAADRAEAAAGSVKPYVDGALSDLSTAANKFYPTLALANADIANIQVNQPIHVGEVGNGGLWYKATSGATTLTKSAFDPLTQAKDYTNTFVNTRNNLADDFTYVGRLSATDDLNVRMKEGAYLTNAAPLNAPEGINPNVLITNQNIQHRYIQTIYDLNDSRKRWQRVIRFSSDDSFTSAETWRDLYSYPRDGLADSFLYVGVLTSADDLNSIYKDGTYLATSVPDNAPVGVPSTSFINVSRAGAFVKQTIGNHNEAPIGWQRTMQLTGGGTFAGGEWINLDPLSNVASQSELGVVKAGAGLDITVDGTLSVITPSQDNPFAGKKIVCFGDSITEFKTYPQQLGQILGAEGINVGFGGCLMSAHWTDDYKEMCMYRLADYIASGDYSGLIAAAQDLYTRTGDDNREIVARLAAIDWNTVDYITILYGTNDFANSKSLGDATDVTPDGSNYLGSANYAIQQLQTTYPHLKIAMITPIYRARGANGGTDSDDSLLNGNYLRDFANGLDEVAKLNHIPCFNLHDDSGINKYTASLYLNPPPDGVHLTEAGATFLAQKIAAKMRANF